MNRFKEDSVKLFNVVFMGVCFCCIFIGFGTLAGVQTLIFDSAKNINNTGGYVEGFHGNGLWSLSILYGVFTFSNLLAPSVILLLGPRLTMMLGGVLYVLYNAQLLILNDFLLYGASGLLGFGAAILWAAQGNFLTLNSDSKTMSRNSGIFWAIMISGNFFGNVFVYFLFQGKSDISSQTRYLMGSVLVGATALGVVLMLFLQPTPWANRDQTQHRQGAMQVLRDSIGLLATPNIAILSILFMYTGAAQNLQGAVYSTAIGFNHQFGEERKGLATLSGIFVALGEVIGGTVLGIFGHLTVRKGGYLFTIAGFIISTTGYVIIHLNIPDNATMGETGPQDTSVIDSNVYLALITSCLLGLADSCFVTQIFSLLGRVYSQDSSSAFAIMKFVQSASAAVAFLYSPLLGLHTQIYIAFILSILGTAAFCYVEIKYIRLKNGQ